MEFHLFMLPFHLTALDRTSWQPLYRGQDPWSLTNYYQGREDTWLRGGQTRQISPTCQKSALWQIFTHSWACQTSGWEVQPPRQKAAPTPLEHTQGPATIPRAVDRLAGWTKGLGGSSLLCKRRKVQRECLRHGIGAGTLGEAEGPESPL